MDIGFTILAAAIIILVVVLIVKLRKTPNTSQVQLPMTLKDNSNNQSHGTNLSVESSQYASIYNYRMPPEIPQELLVGDSLEIKVKAKVTRGTPVVPRQQEGSHSSPKPGDSGERRHSIC